MPNPSIRHQVNLALEELVWEKEEIDAYKAEHQVPSVKKALRPNGDPTAGLPAILSVRTKACYLQTCTTFFKRAWELTGKKKLRDLMNTEVILQTLDTYYIDLMPATHRLEDAPLIIDRLWEIGSKYALPAEVVLRCGLRLSEIAGLKGEDIDLENLVMHIKGKGGRHRTISIPSDLADQLDNSQQYIFKPSPFWKSSFYQAIRRAARFLGIKISGVHRLRANCAQNDHKDWMEKDGLTDHLARMQVSQKLGHNRISVTKSYVP